MMWAIFRSGVAYAMLPIAALMMLSSVIALFADGTVRTVALLLWVVFAVSWTALLALYVYAGWRSAR